MMDTDRGIDFRIRFRRLPMTPNSIHVNWCPSATNADIDVEAKAVEVASVADTSFSVCARRHCCASLPIWPGHAILTASVCDLLHVAAEDYVRISPVALCKVLVMIKNPSSERASGPRVTISSAAAAETHVKVGDDVVVCPGSYAAGRFNMRTKVCGLETGDNWEKESILWLSPEEAALLGVNWHSTTYIFKPTNVLTNGLELAVLEHPGFCYLTAEAVATHKMQSDGVTKIGRRGAEASFAQVHLLSNDMGLPLYAHIDPAIADEIEIKKSRRLKALALDARLYWAAKEPLDDLRNKARNVVSLSEEVLDRLGYAPLGSVRLYVRGKEFPSVMERTGGPLVDGALGLTPLLMRRSHVRPGQGVFLTSRHEPYTIARVGIFNVEEIGSTVVKGSDHLAKHFKMPCKVEIRNPDKMTGMDVWLEPDPYARPVAMVRMSRTIRQLLMVERNQEVLIKPVAPRGELRSFGQEFKRIVTAPIHGVLILLIGRRRIHMSIAPGHMWDDQAQVVRIDPEALSVLGIGDGDRLRVFYRGKSISRVALKREVDAPSLNQARSSEEVPQTLVPVEFQIGLDALGRYILGEGDLEFRTVVEVERDMAFVLKKSLNLSILPILGTVVTVVTLFAGLPIGQKAVITLVLAVLFFYLALSVERSKVI